MTKFRCRHGEWGVCLEDGVNDDWTTNWRCAFPPPPVGTLLELMEWEAPPGAEDVIQWRIVDVHWIAVYCSQCDETTMGPTVTIAPIGREETT